MMGKCWGEKEKLYMHISIKLINACSSMCHEKCNMNRRRVDTVNIYCHNGSAFDFNFLISQKLQDKRIKRLSGLPTTEERL